MSKDASWYSKWQRSPRQDRRVVVNGKFVELTDPIHPKEEKEETRVEKEIRETGSFEENPDFVDKYEGEGTNDTGTSAGTDVSDNQGAGSDGGKHPDPRTGSGEAEERGPSTTLPIPDAVVSTPESGTADVAAFAAALVGFEADSPVEVPKAGLSESEKLQAELEPLPDDSIGSDFQ